jgi:DNA-binding LytR/AlgR family response regulator
VVERRRHHRLDRRDGRGRGREDGRDQARPRLALEGAPPRRHLVEERPQGDEPDEIFFLEAQGDETDVRTRGRRRLRDVRALGQVLARLPRGRFVPIHRSLAVNVDRVAEVRRRAGGRDWELRLEAPVNRVLPVARGRVAALWAAYGET